MFRVAFAWIALLACAVEAKAAPLPRANLQLTFADEFRTFSWDEKFHGAGKAKGAWRTSYMNARDRNALTNRTLPDNGELQIYVDKAYPEFGKNTGVDPFEIVEGDVLRISANPAAENIRDQIYGRAYTSGMISTWGSFAQRYGVFEIRARLPKGQGLWPAFWLLNRQGGWPPEIDIAEVLGHKPDQVWTTVHTGVGGRPGSAGQPNVVGDTSAAFHVYAVDWGPVDCVFYFDGEEVWRHPTPPDANKPMFLIINLAVGGKWPRNPDETTGFPAHLDIDYVRVWQRREYLNARSPKPWPASK